MAKADIESAFRLLPVHPDSYHLLGFQLDSQYNYNKCLPMGCAISCAHFEAFSTFLEWELGKRAPGGGRVHYLDDFLFIGEAGTEDCNKLLREFESLAEELGIPLEADKTEGPTTRLTFLGIELDSVAGTYRLPQEKVEDLRANIRQLTQKKKATLKELQQVIGKLNFATRVIPAGRAFAKRLAWLTRGLTQKHHRARLTEGVREDMEQWDRFLRDFNGTLIWQKPWVHAYELELYTDSAGGIGFGAILGTAWTSGAWPQTWHDAGVTRNIALLELVPIVVAFNIWATELANRQITLWSDNQAVVQAVNTGHAHCARVAALLRRLLGAQFRGNIAIRARHIAGAENSVADAISRFQWAEFRELAPAADREMTPMPEEAWTWVDPGWEAPEQRTGPKDQTPI